MTILSFTYFIQRLCNEAGVLEITKVYRCLEVMSIAHTNLIKDPANLILAQLARAPPTMRSSQFQGPSVLAENVDMLDMDVDYAVVDIDTGEHKDALEVSL